MRHQTSRSTGLERGATDALCYQAHAATLLAYIYHRLPVPQEAEDLLLDVFLAALQNQTFSTLSGTEQLAWLKRVAHHKLVDHYRRSRRVRFLPLELALQTVDEELTPEQHALQREAYAGLYQVLTHLSPLEQQVIHLRFGNDLSFAQIAELLGKPENTLRALLSRTLSRLRLRYPEPERS
ncbi:MAG: sigma-70 family RNA polymerase sigma factor [Ktedonobacteraceae bacterium]|nr:sigma-70 family RNA polymerase sigma factor [Chloroflexota bacterium]